MNPHFNRLVIVGVGLLGGSIAAAAKKRQLAHQYVGIDACAAHLDFAKHAGWIDQMGQLDANTLQSADLVILCTPVSTLPSLCAEALKHLPPHAILSDVGSTKASLINAVSPLLTEYHQKGQKTATFIPAHPIAGRELSGPEAADAELFQDKVTIITPLENTPDEALNRLRYFWEALGSRVKVGSALWHDQIFAEVSHAPHLLAFLASALIDQHPLADELWALAGTGLRDFTRIGAGNPTMWCDISLHNREAILESLKNYRTGLNTLIEDLTQADASKLYTLFERGRSARKKRWD